MPITDVQKSAIKELGDDPIKAALEIHRDKLEKVSGKALELIEEELPEAKFSDKVKAYEATRKQLNVIDGLENNTIEKHIIIIPGELVNNYQDEIKKQLCQNPSNSTPPSQKSLKTQAGSESLIVEGVLAKPSYQAKR